MKPNLRSFKIFLILIAFMVGNFAFAQQKALTEKDKLAKELQVQKAGENAQDIAPGPIAKFNYNKPVTGTLDFSKKGGRGLLIDNGPFVTHPGGGVGGADVSLLESPNTSYGSNMNSAAGYRMADDFTATADWSVDSLVFYGYQTNSTLASTFTGLFIQIWDGDPSLATSSVIWGDLTTNRMTATYWTGCYRATDFVTTARPVMAIKAATTGLVLPAGNYWIDYCTTGSLSSGPWANPITIVGEINTGNALQWTGTAWQAVVDGGSAGTLGEPFKIYGTEAVNPDILYATDFEAFTAGVQVACQDNVNWTTWSNAPCGAEDAMVSTDFAHSGVNSVKDEGSNDLVLNMGNKTTGKYEFSFEMYIPADHGGYYNVLHNFAGSSSEWGLEFYFEDAGTAQLHAAGQIIAYPYTHDTWFTVTNIIDLDNDLAEVLIDGTSVYSWQWSLDPSTGNPGLNQLSAADFFSGSGASGIVNPLYYFDDVEYKVVSEPPVVLNPPRNLEALVVGQNVHLSWDPPQGGGNEFFEGFEDGSLPTGWLAIDNDGDGYNWLNTIEQGFDFEAHTGNGAMTSASYMNNIGALTPDNWLITPPIAVTATSQLIYWHSAQDPDWADEHYYVKISTTTPDLTSFTTTVFDGVTPQTWEENTIDLSAFAGQTIYIAFEHCEVTDMFYMKLDDIQVTGTATRAVASPKVAPAHNQGFAFRTSGMTPEQAAAKQLVYNDNHPSRALVGYNVYRDGTKLNAATITDLFYDDGGLAPGTYAYTATAVYDEGESNPTAPVEATVQPGGMVVVNIGDGTELPGTPRTPFDFYWKNSLCESLYYPEEIGQPAGSQIVQIGYHNNFVSSTLVDKPIQIFIGETSQMDLSTGYIPAGDLVLVYDGTVDFPQGINDIIIPLQTPYTYMGGNLVVMTFRVLDTQYFSSSDKWYSTTTASYPGRTIGRALDSTPFDPYNPPTDGSVLNLIPNTTLYMMPGGGSTIYATDFESFTAGGQVACQDPVNWTTWSNAPCGDEDAFVTTEMAHSGVNAVRDELANDLVLQLGNKTDGKYEMNFWMYIPAGYGGYYNILHNFAGASSEWGLEFYFNDNGNADLHAAGQIITVPYNHGQWFEVSNIIDLNNDQAEVLLDGVSVYTWQWSLDPSTGNPGLNQLSAADFFSGTGVTGITPLYYFDDVEYKTEGTPPTNPRIVVTPSSFSQDLEPNATATQIMNIANTGNADLDFTIDVTYPVKSVKILNHQPQYERIITKAPAQKGAITVDKPGYKMIPDVVNPANIVKSAPIVNKHAPTFGRANVYYNQTGNPSAEGAIASQTFTDLPAYSCAGADDFEVPSGATWDVSHVFVNGIYYNGGFDVPAADVVFYADASGAPGAAVATYTAIPAIADATGNLNIFLPTPATLTAGHYWIAVAANMDYATHYQWMWSKEAAPQILNEIMWENPGDGFGYGYTTWTLGSIVWSGYNDYNLSFALTDSTQAPQPTGWLAADPVSGTVPAGSNMNVEVTFDATGLAVGTYNGMLLVNSNDPYHPVKEVPATLRVKVPGAMPLVEDWGSGSFGTNDWGFDPAQGNWSIKSTYGNPAPSAQFGWSPSVTNYNFSLVSPVLNATAISDNVTLKFDLELNNFSTSTVEGMAVEVFDGTTWQMVQDYQNTNGSFAFTSYSFNITSLAAGHNFSVRFRAYGENSFNINYWYLDNIKIYQQVVGNLTGTITKLSDGQPIEGALVTIQNALSGSYTATTGANGVYTITGAEAGAYAYKVKKEGFNDITGDVTVVGNQTTTLDFQMTAPIIGVNPASIAVTVAVGETTTRTVTVTNTGNGPLDWSGSIHSTTGPVVYYATDFEAFTAGIQVACQDNVNWTTWSNAPCGAEDAMVSTDFAHSGVNSVKDEGSNDLVLNMGNKTSGKYELSFEMYIPAGHGGYYNILHNFAGSSSEWGLEFYFEDAGTAQLHAAGQIISYPYTHDTWFTVTNIIDLDNDLAEVLIDGNSVYSWQWSLDPSTGNPGLNQLSAADFFSGSGATGIVNPLYYFDDVVYKSADVKKAAVHASNGEFARGTAAPSILRAPAGNHVAGVPQIQLKSRSLAYACDIYPGMTFFNFSTDDPGTTNIISTIDASYFGGTFDAVNTDFMYVIDYDNNQLKKLDLASGAVTLIGSCMPYGSESWTGITVDKTTNTMYGISTDISESHIYTINMETGAATVIGATGIPGGIDVTIDGTGQMYSFDLVNDEAYKIDKATGASTLLGSLGYDANYAQGMGWDPATDIIYLAAYNNDGSGGELRILDRETGATTLVGGFPGGDEIDALGFPGGGGGNWASIEPASGTVPAGGSQDITVTFDGNYVPPQKDLVVQGVLTFKTTPNVGEPEVALQMTITGAFFGVLQGVVTHGGVPVQGVTVTATRQESPVYTYEMVTGADGAYNFPTTLYGTYDFTAEKEGFNPFSATGAAVVVGDQTTTYNIAMVAPIMVINPLEINETVPFGTIITRTITVQNTGDGTLDWAAVAASTDKQQISVPASNGEFPRGTAAPSIKRAPAGNHVAGVPQVQLKSRSLGYACDIYPGMTFFSFNTDDPGTTNIINTIDASYFGGTFDAVNTDFMYVIDYDNNQLKKLDIASGTATLIGSCMPYGSESWTGITVDKTTNIMYGISTDISESHIYTINMETGAATVIGATGIPGAIDFTIDGTGQMYSFDLVNDEAYKIDKETGASTLLGSLGYDANYAQGMGWDPEQDIVYLAAYNNDGSGGELRILDRETGATELVGGFPDGDEIDALAFPGGGTPPWLTIAPKNGILPAGASEEMTVTLDGSVPPEAKDFTRHGTITFTSDPNVGTIVVPITFTVTGDFYGALEGVVSHGGVGIPNATVVATKAGHAPYTATTDGNGHYLIQQILGGTYDVTAEAAGFNPYATTGVVIAPPATTTLNITMTAPTMTVTPNELTVNLTAGQTTDRTLTIANGGDGMLEWSGSVHMNAKQAINIPASNGEFPRGTAAPSIMRAPAGSHAAGVPQIQLKSRSLAYACDIYPGMTFFNFNTDTPGTTTTISSIDASYFGGTFDAVNADFMYVIDYDNNQLKKLDIASGAVTLIGSCMPYGSESWTGITVDRTTNIMYGISTDISESHIYTINMETGAATVIAATGIPGAIDVTIDGTGQMYSFDLVNDEAYAINKETGASTLLGSLGYDANYAQGMGWDPATDIVYLAAYNNDGSGGELRILDRTTGATTLVGGFPGGDEIDALSFPGAGTAPWLTMDPHQGTIPGGSSQNATVHFDATDLGNGTYTGYITFVSDPNIGTVNVPVTLIVGPVGGPTLTISEVYNVSAGPVSVPVLAEEIENMGSFQFTLDYDASKLTYTGTSNWYEGITDVLVGTPAAGKLTFVWAASAAGVTITAGTFFNIDFTYNGSLEWGNIGWSDNPTPREFADYNGVIFVPTYNNGFVTGHGIGVPETETQAIKVYPNPATDVVNVKSDFTIKSIEILSFIGQTVYAESNLDTKLAQINVSGLGAGVYFVKMNTSDGVKTTKITVKH